jgi:hypothetical protein
MRYLKRYKIFESFGDIKAEIKDILRECEDMGLHISVHSRPYFYDIGIHVEISAVVRLDVHQIQFKDILPNIQHLINYMNSIGYITFNYVDTLSEFNIHYTHEYDDYTGQERARVAFNGGVNNILPPNDNSISSWIGIGKMMFLK